MSGDSVTVPAPVRNEYDGWYISANKIYRSGDKFATAAGESAYTLYAHLKKKKKSSGGGSSGSSLKPAFTGTWGNPVTGIWTQDANGEWHFRTNAAFVSTWGYIVNPYAQAGQNQADWFWFDYNGCMLIGWRYINGLWYYLNPLKDGTFGACFIGPGRTPDGYEIDESGAWTGRRSEVN